MVVWLLFLKLFTFAWKFFAYMTQKILKKTLKFLLLWFWLNFVLDETLKWFLLLQRKIKYWRELRTRIRAWKAQSFPPVLSAGRKKKRWKLNLFKKGLWFIPKNFSSNWWNKSILPTCQFYLPNLFKERFVTNFSPQP